MLPTLTIPEAPAGSGETIQPGTSPTKCLQGQWPLSWKQKLEGLWATSGNWTLLGHPWKLARRKGAGGRPQEVMKATFQKSGWELRAKDQIPTSLLRAPTHKHTHMPTDMKNKKRKLNDPPS